MKSVLVAAAPFDATDVVTPPSLSRDGFANDWSSESHVLLREAGIAYAVAQTRVCTSLDVGSTPPSSC